MAAVWRFGGCGTAKALQLFRFEGNATFSKLRAAVASLVPSCYMHTDTGFGKYPSLSSRGWPSKSCFQNMMLPSSTILSRGVGHMSMYGSLFEQSRTSVLSSLRTEYGATSIVSRNITKCSKLGKRKTCKAVAKRFLRTGKGKLKRWRAGKNHNMMKKRNKRRRQLRKPTYVSKQQLKLLNKMLNGW